MKRIRFAQAFVLIAALAAVTALPAAPKIDFKEATSAGELEKVKVKNIDRFYGRPRLTLAPYTKVMIEPAQVAFRKDFEPQRDGSRTKLLTGELARIRTDVGKVVDERFAKELAKDS